MCALAIVLVASHQGQGSDARAGDSQPHQSGGGAQCTVVKNQISEATAAVVADCRQHGLHLAGRSEIFECDRAHELVAQPNYLYHDRVSGRCSMGEVQCCPQDRIVAQLVPQSTDW